MDNDKSASMRPFVVKDLIGMVMARKNMAFDDALFYVYSSALYTKLLDDEARMWYLSTVELYDMLDEEKRALRYTVLPEKLLMYRVFCIESYCDFKDLYHEDALVLFRQYGIFKFLDDTFEVLHTQDARYIVDTIDRVIKSIDRKR